jgi:hypothetical protein
MMGIYEGGIDGIRPMKFLGFVMFLMIELSSLNFVKELDGRPEVPCCYSATLLYLQVAEASHNART